MRPVSYSYVRIVLREMVYCASRESAGTTSNRGMGMAYASGDLPDSDTRGIPIAGWSLALALFAALDGKGVFSKAQTDGILETVLHNLKSLQGPDDAGIQKARVLVDAIAHSMTDRPGK